MSFLGLYYKQSSTTEFQIHFFAYPEKMPEFITSGDCLTSIERQPLVPNLSPFLIV